MWILQLTISLELVGGCLVSHLVLVQRILPFRHNCFGLKFHSEISLPYPQAYTLVIAYVYHRRKSLTKLSLRALLPDEDRRVNH